MTENERRTQFLMWDTMETINIERIRHSWHPSPRLIPRCKAVEEYGLAELTVTHAFHNRGLGSSSMDSRAADSQSFGR